MKNETEKYPGRREVSTEMRKEYRDDREAEDVRRKEEKQQVQRESADRGQEDREQTEREQAKRKQIEREQADRKWIEREQADREQTGREQAEREQTEGEQTEKERTKREQMEREQAKREQIEKEQADRKQEDREQTEAEQADRKQEGREQIEAEQAEREQTEGEQTEKERTKREQTEKEQAKREQIEKEQVDRKQEDREQIEKEQEDREQAERGETGGEQTERKQIETKWAEMEKEIRNSAGDIEIPEDLQPEHLHRLLKKKEQERKLRFSSRRLVRAAAWAVIVLAGVLASGYGYRLWRMESSLSHNTESYAVSGNAADSYAAESQKEEAEEQGTEDTGERDFFKEAEDYEEIYEAVYTRQSKKSVENLTSSSSSQAATGEESFASSADTVSSSAGSAEMAEDYSDTNIRTQGVDEADITKTDGNYIYTISGDGRLRITEIDGSQMNLVSVTEIENIQDIPREMYVSENMLYLVTTESSAAVQEDRAGTAVVTNTEQTTLRMYDITDRSKPVEKQAAVQSGNYETSRFTDGYIYMISQYYPYTELFDKEEKDSFIPLNDNGLLAPEDIVIPKTDAGQEYLVISAIDAKSGKTEAQKAVLMSRGLYYVSQKNVYICAPQDYGQGAGTNILRMAYEKGSITAEKAGFVEGYIKDSFCIDEYEDHLRVVCEKESSTGLYILNMDMKQTGKITDIAAGENLKSARFMGDTGYFVTYKEMDPLFCVDLKTPENPKLLGELKVSGFSEYLHSFGENRLLGIGWETDSDSGVRKGLKLSMFDVSNPGEMKELHKLVIANVDFCPGFDDYKRILADPQQGLIGLAAEGYDRRKQEECQQYIAVHYSEKDGFQIVMTQNLELWRKNGSYEPVFAQDSRGLYVGDVFYLCTPGGIAAYDRTKEYENTGLLNW